MSFQTKLRRKCAWCKKVLTKKTQKKFCSLKCRGLSVRGSGKSHIRIRVNGKRVYLHRWKFEKRIRSPKPGEIIHHLDENKFNNQLDNFEVLDSQAAHLQRHDFWRNRRARIRAHEESEFREFGW